MINNIEDKIFNLAIDRFFKNTEIQLTVETEEKEKFSNNLRFDKPVKFRHQKKDLFYYVEIEPNINNAIIALLMRYKESLPHPLLFLTRYISNNIAEELKKNRIQFIDTAGNAYIDNYPLFVFIKGNKPNDKFFKDTPYRAFEPSGLKIIYTLLCDHYLIKKPYRYIAKIATVALGTVGWVINDLIKLGFAVDMGKKGRRLLKKEELFNRWSIVYNEKLRPKLLIDKFMGPEDWWNRYKLNPEYAQWGGEVAANKLTNYIKPASIILYTNRENYHNVLIENKLRKDINGDTELLERFWEFDKDDEFKETVNPILIYTDLINTGNQRDIETARMIYEKYINRHIREA
jgi:hypothetical protein